jgi:hypothetical protein
MYWIGVETLTRAIAFHQHALHPRAQAKLRLGVSEARTGVLKRF